MSGLTIIIVQARMGSTRLPGKSMREVLGKPLLGYVLDRLNRAELADKVIVATSDLPRDQVIFDYCHERNVPCFRGGESDVLDRYYQAARQFKAETIVRITGDCPLIDPEIVDRVIAKYSEGNYDYASNVFHRHYPRGLDTEVFSYKTLHQAWRDTSDPHDREHVTTYIWQHPDLFRIGSVVNDRDLSNHHWAVDTPQDFTLITRIIETLAPTHPNFTMNDILNII